jgi:hypothetical protein
LFRPILKIDKINVTKPSGLFHFSLQSPSFGIAQHHHYSASSSGSSPLFGLSTSNNKPTTQKSSNSKLETKIAKFLANTLLGSRSILETRVFTDLLATAANEQVGRGMVPTSLRYTGQLVPQLVDLTEKRMHDLIVTCLHNMPDSQCSISIDFFNDFFSTVDVNDLGLSAHLEHNRQGSMLFSGYFETFRFLRFKRISFESTNFLVD